MGFDQVVYKIIDKEVIELPAEKFSGLPGGKQHGQKGIQLSCTRGSGITGDDLVVIKSGEGFFSIVMVARLKQVIIVKVDGMARQYPCGLLNGALNIFIA